MTTRSCHSWPATLRNGLAAALLAAATIAAQAPAPAPAPPPLRPPASTPPILPPATAAPQPAPAPQASAAPRPVFTPFKPSAIYEAGDTVGWTMHAADDAPVPPGGYTYTIRRNNLEVLETGTLDASPAHQTIDVTMAQPGMVYVEVTAPGGEPGAIAKLGAAVAPQALQPSAPRPADFDAFWDGKLAALARVPIDPVLTPTDSPDPNVELFTVTLRSLGSTAHGYLAKPKGPGPFPGLVLLQWAGVYKLAPKAALDRAAEGWLILNLSAHDMPLDRDDVAPPKYGNVGNTDRETSYFLPMYLRDVRAVDYVASRPDWNGKTLVLMGTSMGGQQSIATAGLHPKVTAVLVNEPAGADANGDLHGRRTGYPWSEWPKDDPKAMATGLYFDIVNFAPRITAPAVVTVGFIDTITPPVGILTMFNQIRSPKELIPMIESDHNNRTPEKQGDWEARWRAVLAALVGGGTFTPAGH